MSCSPSPASVPTAPTCPPPSPPLPPQVTCDASTEYFDTAALQCISCSTDDDNKEPDFSTVDFYGNALGCKCSLGFKRVYALDLDTCDEDVYHAGSCVGFTCASCLDGNDDDTTFSYPWEQNPDAVAFSDGDACALCGPSTDGPSGDDCACPTNYVLSEVDDGLEYTANKTCTPCADGTAVITSDATIAGVDYYASDYACQRCPDPHMSFNSAGTVRGGRGGGGRGGGRGKGLLKNLSRKLSPANLRAMPSTDVHVRHRLHPDGSVRLRPAVVRVH